MSSAADTYSSDLDLARIRAVEGEGSSRCKSRERQDGCCKHCEKVKWSRVDCEVVAFGFLDGLWMTFCPSLGLGIATYHCAFRLSVFGRVYFCPGLPLECQAMRTQF